MNALLQDIRFGARMLAKSPGFTAAALTTLALGIGVNTAMFSIINAMQKTPQRFADSDELVFLWRHTERYEHGSISALDYFDLREQAQSFAMVIRTGSTPCAPPPTCSLCWASTPNSDGFTPRKKIRPAASAWRC